MKKDELKDFNSFLKEKNYWDNNEPFFNENEETEKDLENSDIKPSDDTEIEEVDNELDEPNSDLEEKDEYTSQNAIDDNKKDGCKIVFLNGTVSTSEHESLSEEVSTKLKEKLGICEEVKLFQLNIQPVNDGNEPNDGMVQVYEAVEGADCIIVVTDVKKGQISSVLQTAMERISNHYKEKELRNVVFGSVVRGDEESFQNVKANLLNYATNLGMIVGADCQLFCGIDELEIFDTDITNASICIKELCSATATIRTAPSLKTISDTIKDFDQFKENPEDVSDIDKETEDMKDSDSEEKKPDIKPEDEESYDYENDIPINKLEANPSYKPNPVRLTEGKIYKSKKNIIKALTDLASKSKNVDKFIKNITLLGNNFGIDSNSKEFMEALDLKKGDTENNKNKMKQFYKEKGIAKKKEYKHRKEVATTSNNIDKIVKLALDADKDIQKKIKESKEEKTEEKQEMEKKNDMIPAKKTPKKEEPAPSLKKLPKSKLNTKDVDELEKTKKEEQKFKKPEKETVKYDSSKEVPAKKAVDVLNKKRDKVQTNDKMKSLTYKDGQLPETNPVLGKIVKGKMGNLISSTAPTNKIKEEVLTFDKFFKMNETGEWNRHIDWEYVKDNPDDDSEEANWIRGFEALLDSVKDMLPDTIQFEIIDIQGFDKYQGPYAMVSINGKKYKIWGANYDELYIENFPINNNEDGNPGFIGLPEDVAEAIEEISNSNNEKIEESVKSVVLGKTKSGKSVHSRKNACDYKSFTTDDHKEASLMHSTHVGVSLGKENKKFHKDMAAKHKEEAKKKNIKKDSVKEGVLNFSQFLKLNENFISGSQSKPFEEVEIGDIATDYNGEEWIVLDKGKAKDFEDEYGSEMEDDISLDDDVIIAKNEDDEETLFLYGDSGAVVYEESSESDEDKAENHLDVWKSRIEGKTKKEVDFEEEEEVSHKLGIDFQSDFTIDEKDSIRSSVEERIADLVTDGVKSGQLLGEEPDYQGWFNISIDYDDEHDEDETNEEVARLIRNGNSSGYNPNFSWSAKVWKDEEDDFETFNNNEKKKQDDKIKLVAKKNSESLKNTKNNAEFIKGNKYTIKKIKSWHTSEKPKEVDENLLVSGIFKNKNGGKEELKDISVKKSIIKDIFDINEIFNEII